jgi:trans-aconitate methyltransferase
MIIHTTEPLKELLGPSKYAEYLAQSTRLTIFQSIHPHQLTNEELIVLVVMLQATISEINQCITDTLAPNVHSKSAH